MDTDVIKRLPHTMLEDALRKIGLPWIGFTVLMALLVMLIETPHEIRFGAEKYIHTAVFDCIIVAYSLTAWSVTRHFLAVCLQSLAPLTNGSLPGGVKYSPREWQFSLGLAFMLTFIANVNNPELGRASTWMNIFSTFIAYAMFGWIMYGLLASAKQITQFIIRTTTVNIFDVSPFRPVAHWCLSAAAVIMGAITIASLFLGEKIFATPNLITYGIASMLGIFVFFAGMWSTHQHMFANKEREINNINQELQGLHEEILAKTQNRDFENSRALLDVSASLTAHRDRIERVPDWPYTIGSLGGLASSIIIPVIINMISKFL